MARLTGRRDIIHRLTTDAEGRIERCPTLIIESTLPSRRTRAGQRALACALAVTLCPSAVAGQAPNQPASAIAAAVDVRPLVTATRVAEGPVLDGDVLGDTAWQRAAPVSTFWQEQPEQGEPASERTEVRVVFTGDTLYIGVVCYDNDPQSITVSDFAPGRGPPGDRQLPHHFRYLSETSKTGSSSAPIPPASSMTAR